jgi:hypothetical protein
MDDAGFTEVLENLQFPKAFVGTEDMRKLVQETVDGLETVVAATQE